jgi:hypothetical protein
MLGLRKLLQRDPVDSPVTEVDASGHSPGEITEEYRSLILDQLVRGGVSSGCVEIEVKQGGKSRDGRFVYIVMLRLVRWERSSALRLLLGLPILESRLRRSSRGSWVSELSHFGGIWLHASGQLQDTLAMEDLRSLLIEVDRRDAGDSKPPTSSGGVWSLPTDMGTLRE